MTQVEITPMRMGLIAAILCCGILLLVATSVHGIGYYSDSFSYLSGAESLAVEGITSTDYALVHYPPLLSIVLMILNNNPTLILLLNTLLLCANMALMARMLQMADVEDWLIIGAVLSVGFFPIMILLYGTVLSEALFLVMMQAALILLYKRRIWWVLPIVALAPLQRYVGISLVIAATSIILVQHGWRRAGVFGAIAVIPAVLWSFRNYLVVDNIGRPLLGYRPIPFDLLLDGAHNIAPWLFPVLAIVLGTLLLTRRLPSPPLIIRFCLWYIFFYFAFLFVSISFFDYSTPLDFRIMAPFIVLSWIIAIWLLHETLRDFQPVFRQMAIGAFVLLVIAYIGVSTVYVVVDLRPKGLGLVRAIRPVHEEVLEMIPEETEIYTNNVSVTRMLGRESRNLPFTFDLRSPEAIAAFDEQMNRLINRVYNGEAVVLWYEEIERTNMVSLEELKAFLPYRGYDQLIVFVGGPLEQVFSG